MKKPHEADLATEAAIERAAYFTVNLRVDGQNIMHELKRLDQAREAGRLLVQIHKSAKRPLIYAVDPAGRQWFVPDTYQTPTEKTETDAMLNHEVVTMRCATAAPDAQAMAASAGGPAKEHLSAPQSDRSNCRRAMLKYAAKLGISPDLFEVIEIPAGQAAALGMKRAFAFQEIEQIAKPAAAPKSDLAQAAEIIGRKNKPTPNGGADPLPAFLDRTAGKSKEEIAAERDRLVARDMKREIHMPKTKIKNPPNRASAGAKALGMPVGSAHKAGAVVKRAKPEKANAADRARYDWKGAEEMASKGKVPPTIDFSAPTHARFRPALAEVVKAAKAGDDKALKAIAINPISSSPKALARYRDLCVKALKAKAA